MGKELQILNCHAGWRWDNTYAQLPSTTYARVLPTRVASPRWVLFNRHLAEELGLDAEALGAEHIAGAFAGNQLFEGSEPIAQAYAGHQFGHLSRLGDGRAILLGEHVDGSGRRWDIQLKGPGCTPYSRQGDGRAALGPMLREYVISEAIHALGIPTTRSLAVVETGEPVFRETRLRGAVLTRVASSHLRVGTLELFAAQGDFETLDRLCRYALERHYPERTSGPNLGLALLEAVMERQAKLVAEWMRVGFVHGVMNTDNVALSGETIDYGPCAFMDAYDPGTVFSSIDQQGRYAFGNQPGITSWNLARLAEALLPLIDVEQSAAIRMVEEVLETFPQRYHEAWLKAYRGKLGLLTEEAGDRALIEDLLRWMKEAGADFTLTFRELDPEAGSVPSAVGRATTTTHAGWASWHARWVERLRQQGKPTAEVLGHMRAVNPGVIPRNHVVEAALRAASERQDVSLCEQILVGLRTPYADPRDGGPLSRPPAEGTPRYRTFCGT